MDFSQDGSCKGNRTVSHSHKQLHAVKVADVLKGVFIKHLGGKPTFAEHGISYAVGDKFHKFRFYRFNRSIVKYAGFVTHLKVFHVLRQNLTNPLLYQLIQAHFDAGGWGIVLFVKSRQHAGFILILHLPQVTHNLFETLLTAVGVHEIKQILQTCRGVCHVDDSNAFCSCIDISVNSLIMPFVKGGKLGCIRPLCVNEYGIIKGTLVIPRHTGQQTFPLHRVFGVFLYRLFI